MSLSITQIKEKVTPKMRGTTINQISGFYEKCREAAGNVVLRSKPLETIRGVRIENAIYSHIYNYAIGQDVQGDNGIIDIRPIGQRSSGDGLEGRDQMEFDIKKDRDTFTVEVLNGVKTLRLSKRIAGHSVLHRMDSLTGDGTVTGSGDVTDLTTNNLEKVSGSASVQFGLDGLTGQGVIAINLAAALDLSTIEDVGALFNWLYFPNASRLTNMVFKWGTDASNYWSLTITAPHDRTSFEDAVFTLQRADWVNATETGTPDAAAVDYLEVVLNYTAGDALANVRLDNITAARGDAYEAVYYSDRLFKSAAGDYIELPTADSDTLNIAVDGHNIFLYELMLIIIQELGEKAVMQNAKWFMEQLNGYGEVKGLYDAFNRKYPSKVIPLSTTYHNFGYFGNNDDND